MIPHQSANKNSIGHFTFYTIRKLVDMIRLKFITTIIILTSLVACAPPVTFNEPQPTNTDNLSEFANRLQGHYLSSADSSVLIIDAKTIQRIYDFDYKIHPSQIDSNSRLSGDTIINVTTNTREIVKRAGDSLVTHINYIDTLFQIDYDNVVRKFKGFYFLNKRLDKESWEVKKIELSKGQLIVSSISSKEDIENLKAITESTQDTVAPYNFAATKKQFKEFVKNKGFTDSEHFIRQKKNAE
jgi:hypothetical protein